MRLLAFSDLHTDLDQARELVRRAAEADLVVVHGGSQPEALSPNAAVICRFDVLDVIHGAENPRRAPLPATASTLQ